MANDKFASMLGSERPEPTNTVIFGASGNLTKHSFDTPQEVAQAAAAIVVQSARECITQRGVFHWGLAGGTTPKQCYVLLRDANIDWSKVHVWFGDERCLPTGDVERNDVMADVALLNHISIPKDQVHRIHAELGAEEAAALYAEDLSTIVCLDLVLLGMGEDGHTASLFPANPALRSPDLAVAVFDSPKPPSKRVSMGYSTIKAARRRIILVTGEGKRNAFDKVCAGEPLPVNIERSEWLVSL
ncbi:MAG: 6-phosphogluconolactonase [Mariprofundaceae bacterium]|nr:6-phosphogluconolactonase [Mariprofundaceae bacterium]